MTFTTLFPSSSQPNYAVFIENRLRHLVQSGEVVSRVVAPVPYFPFKAPQFGFRSAFARTPAAEVRSGIPIIHPRYLRIPKIGMSLSPALLFAASIAPLKRLKRDRDFDLIDAHYFFPDGVAAAWLGRHFRKPVVITARGTDVNLIPKYRLPRAMIVAAARHAAGIIAVSQALKDALVSLGVPDERVVVLRNGVDLAQFHPQGRDAARLALGLSGPTLLSVGQLIERKGHHLIIEALLRLKNYTLLIAGDGPDRVALEALAHRLGLSDRVWFLGPVPHGDLQRVYVAADALVLASSREGWPNVLLESMACGTPVIATNAWGNPEVVARPEAGVLTKSRSADAIAEAVEGLFRSPPDRTATRAYAEEFSWDATSAGQVALFRKILS